MEDIEQSRRLTNRRSFLLTGAVPGQAPGLWSEDYIHATALNMDGGRLAV